MVFCCVGALAITGSLDKVDKDLLGWRLCERQVKSGGLNGHPEKHPDVNVMEYLMRCFRNFQDVLPIWILFFQDTENGGFSDRPDDAVDVFHTYFGVAAYALPTEVVNRIFFSR